MNKSIISLALRSVLGFNFLFVATAHLNLWKFYTEEPEKITSWITSYSWPGKVIAVGMLLTALYLLAGYKTLWATISAIVLLLANHCALLFTRPATDPINGPFYNSFHHAAPFIGFSIILLYTLHTPKDISLDRYLRLQPIPLPQTTKNDIVLLVARIFTGLIFFAQGLELITGNVTLKAFAEQVYVRPYEATFVPTFLLWFMGLANPWILCLGGALLVAGIKLRWTAAILAFFLVSIAFGHLLSDPYETTGDISMFGFNNLAFIILILWLDNGKNKYCLNTRFRK